MMVSSYKINKSKKGAHVTVLEFKSLRVKPNLEIGVPKKELYNLMIVLYGKPETKLAYC